MSYTVTRACNLRCLHCHVSAREAMPDELSVQEAMRAIDELANLGTEALIFSGGEPLLRKNFVLTLAEYCDDLGIITAVLSNGLLLDHKVALELKEAGIKAVGIPIDSVRPEAHDRLRDMSGAFNKAVSAIQACLNMDLEVIVTTMALKDTCDEMPVRVDFLESLGVDEVAVYDLIPVGRGRDVMDQAMTIEQRVNLMQYLEAKQEENGVVFAMSGGQPLYPEIATKIHRNHDSNPKDLLLKEFWVHNSVGCHAGIMYLNLRPNGDVCPCTFLPITVGNIREHSLTDIWRSSPTLNKLRQRKTLKGTCGNCGYRETCGGCRARAYACTGDYLETDPICLRDLLIEENINPTDMRRFGFCVG